MKRKILAVWDDLRSYWLVSAGRLAMGAMFWSLVVAAAVVLLPFSKATREKISKKVGFYVGRLFWEFRSIGMLREWLPPLRNMVRTEHRDAAGTLKWSDYGWNLRTNEGRDWQAERMGASGTTYAARFISVHNASGYTPAAGDAIATWNTNELPSGGFSRQSGVYAHTPGNANYTLVHTYTATGTYTIYGAALIQNEAGSKQLFCSKNFGTSASMVANDTLQISWDLTI